MSEQADPHRQIALTKIGEGRWKATNARGGEIVVGAGGDNPDMTPVELLLAAIAGCSAVDVDLITRKRATAESFAVSASGDKVRDEHGNHLVNLTVTFDVTFPAGEEGDAARAVLPRSLAQTRDRLCSVGRTVQIGEPIDYRLSDGR
ncbi:MAG TPA: OsmC family protein [Nocardioides sp.]|nr:OsmC family protein [Nocardioides sp.]